MGMVSSRWLRIKLTELSSVQNPFVEQNDAGTQGNPQAGDSLALASLDRGTGHWRNARNVEGRMEAVVLSSGSTALELAFILVGGHGEYWKR